MYNVLLAGPEIGPLTQIRAALKAEPDIKLVWAGSGGSALQRAAEEAPDLVIVDDRLDDMTALNLVRDLLKINAFINTAAISPLSSEEFHEKSEGLGVMVHLAPEFSQAEIEELLRRIRGMPPLAGLSLI